MTTKDQVADIITATVIEALEAGVLPWAKPWAGGTPVSLSTGRAYRGTNELLLAAAAATRGYSNPIWATFNQVRAAGGTVKKGARSVPVVFWKFPAQPEDGTELERRAPLLRYYRVFNLSDTEGVTVPARLEDAVTARTPLSADAVPEAVSQVIAGYVGGPEIEHVYQGRAYYSLISDKITLPTVEQFMSVEGYAETVLHELVHSTGHPSRLGRDVGCSRFGSDRYAKEELVAELGAVMLASRVGLPVSIDNAASYCGGWLKVLRADKRFLISAGQAAQKAVDLIVGAPIAADVVELETAQN
jgi:antirestriction protein ArdC